MVNIITSKLMHNDCVLFEVYSILKKTNLQKVFQDSDHVCFVILKEYQEPIKIFLIHSFYIVESTDFHRLS